MNTPDWLTQEFLKEHFYYCAESGKFTRIKRKGGKKKLNQKAGFICTTGYIKITIGLRDYSAHRLAWLYMTGDWPKEEIDHINRIKDDNRWCNLREASRMQNVKNQGARGNSTGCKGIRKVDVCEAYEARITVDKKQIYLGYFKTLDEAKNAYEEAVKKYHGEFGFIP